VVLLILMVSDAGAISSVFGTWVGRGLRLALRGGDREVHNPRVALDREMHDSSVALKENPQVADPAVVQARGHVILVTFEVRCELPLKNVTKKLLIVGDCIQLGTWNTSAAVEMTTSEENWPVWSASALLPASQIVEYKYALESKLHLPKQKGGHAKNSTAFNQTEENDPITASNQTEENGSASLNATAVLQDLDENGTAPLNATALLQDFQFMRDGVVFDWEEGGNHILKVGRRSHTVSDEFLTTNLRNADPRPPSFTSMGGGAPFMDGEYCYIATD
jgi:hypothetical protein